MSDPSSSALIHEAFTTAVAHHGEGRLAEAGALYQAILELDPQHVDANYNLGLIALQGKQAAAALPHFKTALTANPGEAQFWHSYIEALLAAGESQAAHEVFQLGLQNGIKLDAQSLGIALNAAAPAPKPIVKPPAAEVAPLTHAFQKRDYAQLEKLALPFIEKYPQAIEGWKSLSLAYYHCNRFDLALQPTVKMVELHPEDAQMHANLGLILWRLRRLDEAEHCFLQALAMDGSVSDTHTNLANVRKDQGRIDDAINGYRRAIELDPNQAVAYSNVGVLLIDRQAFREAEACFRTALKLEPSNPYALRNLSTVLIKLGHLVEAESVIRRAIAVEPENTLAYDLLLFLFNYTHTDPSPEGRALAERYGQLVAKKRTLRYQEWQCESKPQRLRVGIVSADLHTHPVGLFVETLVSNLDPARVELIAYVHMSEQKYDAVTQRLHARFSAWKSIYRLDDKDAAALIHADGIHVLLDLSGHTTDNRLPIFSYKPAPVQASWLGYFATTGVAEMDYLVGDPWLCPPEEENHFTEQVWRLPQTWLSFTPPREDVAVAPLPALNNGIVTFGCFNNLNKVNDAVVALWAKLLQRLPNTRLLLKAPQLRDEAVQADTLLRFAAHGITQDRLLLEGPSPRKAYLEAYARVDIALDPFPYPGGATSVDTLWMGVPVLTQRGNRFLSHLGESIAHNASLSDWIADNADDFIAKATSFASDLPALAKLRHGLRDRLNASPLLDNHGFAAGFVNALWQMWEDKNQAPASKIVPLPPHETERLQRLLQQKKYGELEKLGLNLARKYPHAPEIWRALSLGQYNAARLDAALQSTQSLIELTPQDGAAHATRGLVLIGLARFADAESSLQQAITLNPQLTDPLINLGYIYRAQGQLDKAVACYQKAITTNPALAAAHANLGIILLEQQALRAAETSLRKALSIAPKHSGALLALSSVLVKLSVHEEAEHLIRRLIKLEPDNAQAYSTLLFLLNYRNTSASGEAKALAVRYGKLLTRQVGRQYKTWHCDPQPTRLRIGIVSADLYNHPVGYFLEGLLRALDPTRVEVIAYSNRPGYKNDAASARLQSYCSAWKTIHSLDDAAAAALIHADGIHILLDLAGHTGDSRLPLFAYKPAPIQAAWLGYFATTGVEQMDYLIGDPNVCPPAEAAHFTETIWRMPETYLCFTPPDADIAINALPALANGYITFGCFNNVGKLNEVVIRTWSQILQQTPGSRLLLKARQLGDVDVCTHLRERFAAHGITGERLVLEGPTVRKDYLQAYQRLDIVLDPFPYPGGTTTVEALWMSVPVLTLRGNTMLSHAGENILSNVGLPEWIADDVDDYIIKAAAHAANLDGLTALRTRLRAQALASPMFDAARFAHHFADALWGMWAARKH